MGIIPHRAGSDHSQARIAEPIKQGDRTRYPLSQSAASFVPNDGAVAGVDLVVVDENTELALFSEQEDGWQVSDVDRVLGSVQLARAYEHYGLLSSQPRTAVTGAPLTESSGSQPTAPPPTARSAPTTPRPRMSAKRKRKLYGSTFTALSDDEDEP